VAQHKENGANFVKEITSWCIVMPKKGKLLAEVLSSEFKMMHCYDVLPIKQFLV
jgi:hypothetical protein